MDENRSNQRMIGTDNADPRGVTVIIPVYNTQKYLNKSVSSVLSQTYSTLECILVDDGSDKKCAEKCDALAKLDSRVRVIHAPHKGVSAARNLALDNARYEYITFLDSDDWLPREAIASMMQGEGNNTADMVISSVEGVGNLKSFIMKTSCSGMVNREDVDRWCQSYLTLPVGIWGKLFTKRVVGNTRFREDVPYNEDVLFVYEILAKSDNVLILPKVNYFYNRILPFSTSFRYFPDVCYYRALTLKMMKSSLEGVVLPKQVQMEWEYQIISRLEKTMDHYITKAPTKEECINKLKQTVEAFREFLSESLISDYSSSDSIVALISQYAFTDDYKGLYSVLREQNEAREKKNKSFVRNVIRFGSGMVGAVKYFWYYYLSPIIPMMKLKRHSR